MFKNTCADKHEQLVVIMINEVAGSYIKFIAVNTSKSD